MFGLGGISIKCVRGDYNVTLSPSLRIIKVDKGLNTGQGDPFGCLKAKKLHIVCNKAMHISLHTLTAS